MARWYRAAARDYLKASASQPPADRWKLERRALILFQKADKLDRTRPEHLADIIREAPLTFQLGGQ